MINLVFASIKYTLLLNIYIYIYIIITKIFKTIEYTCSLCYNSCIINRDLLTNLPIDLFVRIDSYGHGKKEEFHEY